MARKKRKSRKRKSTKKGKRKARVRKRVSLLEFVESGEMAGFASLYIDPVGEGFKISIWSSKKGLIEGFVLKREMAPFVRKVLVERIASLNPGESIEVIGKREEDISEIASEPIDTHSTGTLMARVEIRDREVHLKITLHAGERTSPPEHDDALHGEMMDIEGLTEKLNQEIKKNTGVEDYEKEVSGMLAKMKGIKRLRKNPKDKKALKEIHAASMSLSRVSRKRGFIRISQLAESMSLLLETYLHKGVVDLSSLPVLEETVIMLEKMAKDISGDSDVDSLVSRISRKY